MISLFNKTLVFIHNFWFRWIMMTTAFHELMVELGKLGERRNELVHSKYNRWFNVEGKEGLL